MNIAVLIKRTTFHEGFGGLETQNKQLVEGFVKRGHSVTVFSPAWELNLLEQKENGVTYIFVKSSYKYFLSKINYNSWYNRSYKEFLSVHAKNPFDIVVSQSSAGLGIIERKNNIHIKVLSIAHGSALGELRTYLKNYTSLKNLPRLLINTQYSLRQFFGRQREYILHSNHVVAVSTAVKKQLISETFIDEKNISVINNGVIPFEVSLSNQNSSEKINLVYAGQLTKDKGVDLFAHIASDIRFKDFTLHVFGNGPYFSVLEQFITTSPPGATIKLYGKVNNATYIKTLSALSGGIFVFPTKRVEGFPMVLVEAMMAALAPVVYDIGGNNDAVDNTVGALVPFENRENFLNKILEISSNRDKLLNMCGLAQKKALSNFTEEIMLNKYEELISEVIKS